MKETFFIPYPPCKSSLTTKHFQVLRKADLNFKIKIVRVSSLTQLYGSNQIIEWTSAGSALADSLRMMTCSREANDN